MTRKNLLLAFALSACLIFTGCGAAVVGGAAYGGYKGATDKRTIGTIVDDSFISSTIKTKMIADQFIKARHIDVDVLNGVVYLIGVVESASQKRMASDIARGVNGVQQIKNQLIVGSSNAGQVLNDTILTSKIKTELIKNPDIRSTNVDVDTNNNVVTLTGILQSQGEKIRVINAVRNSSDGAQIVDNLSVTN